MLGSSDRKPGNLSDSPKIGFGESGELDGTVFLFCCRVSFRKRGKTRGKFVKGFKIIG